MVGGKTLADRGNRPFVWNRVRHPKRFSSLRTGDFDDGKCKARHCTDMPAILRPDYRPAGIAAYNLVLRSPGSSPFSAKSWSGRRRTQHLVTKVQHTKGAESRSRGGFIADTCWRRRLGPGSVQPSPGPGAQLIQIKRSRPDAVKKSTDWTCKGRFGVDVWRCHGSQ